MCSIGIGCVLFIGSDVSDLDSLWLGVLSSSGRC